MSVDSSSVVAAVEGMAKREQSLRELAGEMVATLRVNRQRGTLTTADNAYFDAMVEKWGRWLEAESSQSS